MKNIKMKKRNSLLWRITALFLCLVMILSIADGFTIPTALAADFQPDPTNALHFIIRHWHTDEVTGTEHQNDTDAFVVIEGYIVPKDANGNGPYSFYFVDQGIAEGSPGRYFEVDDVDDTNYIDDIDPANGKIVLNENHIVDTDNEEDVERFSGFSISAGHNAVSYTDDGEITITYSKYVHLVKGHVFYINESNEVPGTNDGAVFPVDNNGKMTTPEVDTMEIYVYSEDFEDAAGGEHKAGEIYRDGDTIYRKGDTLPEGHPKVTPVKFYSTNEGLHTDKTATAYSDGRTFDLDLEAWYTEGDVPEVGMILDASGSMAFASDTPKPIDINSLTNLTAAQQTALRKKMGLLEYSYVYPKYDSLIGYYDFYKSGSIPETTYTLDAKELSNPSSGDVIDGFFTLLGLNELRTNGNYNGNGYTGSKYLHFNGKVSTSKGIKFTTIASATIKVWWVLGGDGRNMQVLDAGGKAVATTTEGTGKGSGTACFSTIELTDPGTYYLAGDANNYIYKVEITVAASAGTDGLANSAPNATGSVTAVAQQPEGSFSFGGSSSTETLVINDNGFNLKGSDGILLDAVPGDSFTVSFSITGTANNPTFANLIDILYVGAQDGTGSYFRAKRDGSDASNIFVYPSDGRARTRVAGAINQNTHYITFTYENGTLNCYVYNAASTTDMGTIHGPAATINNLSLSDFNSIVLNGFANSYNGDDLYIDDIFVYNATLTADEVAQLCKAINAGAGLSDMNDYSVNWNNIFLTDDELAWILNPRNTDNSLLGASDYSYFVFDTADTTMEYVPLGYWEGSNSSTTDAKTKNGNILGTLSSASTEAGWYFISHGSTWSTYTASNAKQLRTVKASEKYTDAVTLSRDGDAGVSTGVVWQSSSVSAIKFYIDNAGYLRCFYNNGSSALASYVYELKDGEYVKTEALQRALGSFVTQLSERSPASLVSAVRFSLEPVTDLDKLVLLDWTNDAGESADILSLKRGDRGETMSSTPSTYLSGLNIGLSGIDQYNYGLTGSTATYKGLQAFQQLLAPRLKTYETKTNTTGKKYLIIFTDGANTHAPAEAVKIANDLKKEGYTIFAIMLAGGPVKEGGSQYNDAMTFLGSVADKVYYADNVDTLTETFTGDILSLITNELSDYTVTDYIDPRFDLVDKAGSVWHLNKGGEVEIDGTTIDVTTTSITITLSNKSDKDARTPYLRYDSSMEMYYLEWVDQTIPSSAVGATSLPIWNAWVTVRAKDDFIGGNAVLTNGNMAKMNWVYFPGKGTVGNPDYIPPDEDRSSGTDDMYRVENSDEYPSKGFPRTTANVKLQNLEIEAFEQIIYLGETITPADLIKDLSETITNGYYWAEFMERYANLGKAMQQGSDDYKYNDLGELINHLLDQTNEYGIDLPYSYLPDVSGTNQAGLLTTTGQPSDILGVLHYKWERIDPETGQYINDGGYNSSVSDGPKKSGTYTTLDTRTVQYKLTVTYWPYPDPDDPKWKGLDEWEKNPQKAPADRVPNLNNKGWTLDDFLSSMTNALTALTNAVHSANAQTRFDLSTLEDLNANGPTGIVGTPSWAFDKWNKLVGKLHDDQNSKDPGLGALNAQLGVLKTQLDQLDPGDSDYADRKAALETAITAKESQITGKKAEIDELITGLTNDINYFQWCLGLDSASPVSKLTKRDDENKELINETAYGPSTDGGHKAVYPKTAVGDPQYNKTVNGTHTTRIVRGELAFEMTLNMHDLNYLFARNWSTKTEGVTYTVNVERAYSETQPSGDDWSPEIPDLTITIKPDDLANLKRKAADSADGTAAIYYVEAEYEADGTTEKTPAQYPKAVYNSKTGEVTFYSDPRIFDPVYYEEDAGSADKVPVYGTDDPGYARQLPIGTYTLKPDPTANVDWDIFDFGDGLLYAPRSDYERVDGHFTDVTAGMIAENSKDSVYTPTIEDVYKKVSDSEWKNNNLNTEYYAPSPIETPSAGDDVVFQLGTREYDEVPDSSRSDPDATMKNPRYLTDRVGMAMLTCALRYEMPATGGTGTWPFYLAGILLLLAALPPAYYLFRRQRRLE